MSTQILNASKLTDADFVPTSSLKSVRVSTSDTALEVTMSCRGVIFFSTKLYAYNGIIEFFDPGSIIESHFRANGFVFEDIVIRFDLVSITIHVIYCEHDVADGYAFGKLMSTSVRRVHPGSIFSFNAIPYHEATTFSITGVGFDSGGNQITASYTTVDQDTNKAVFRFHTDHIISALKTASSNKMVRIAAFSLAARDMKMTCYVDEAPCPIPFRFRNMFNVQEYIDIIGDIVTKNDTSFNTAEAVDGLENYDRNTVRSYQVTTEPIPAAEIPLYRAMFESRELEVFIEGIFYDAVITELTCEDSTAPDATVSYKFTWRFKSRRPREFSHYKFGYVPADSKIFSLEYSEEYD